ncbi:MAG: NUDIX domain protein [Syntrophorhabdus sp. PtaU1.Bin153]|nr:MAG: NUDIX domain protein [Syntrophorhabdus sp. PtaU1.Bin153]
MTGKSKVAVPKKAATIILLRDNDRGEFEVFLLKRHEANAFMAGNFVYPGGRVDREDSDEEIICHTRGLPPDQAHQILGEPFLKVEDLSYRVAGIRELYEEAGVLLAYDRMGNLLSMESDDVRERFAHHRRQLQKREKTLLQILKEENLTLALDVCHYYAHWITPEARTIRFDTRFFLARHAVGQEATPDTRETTEGVWITPANALQENLKGNVALSPPTLRTLEELSRYRTSDEAIKALSCIVTDTIIPLLLNPLADEIIIFPWDPEYELLERGDIATTNDHGLPSCPSDTTTRLVLKGRCWLPYCKRVR